MTNRRVDGGTLKYVDRAQVEETLAARPERPVLVYFTATWCGPCQTLGPLIEAYSRTSDLPILKVDIDAAGEVADAFGVKGVPMLVLVRGQVQAWRRVGGVDTPEELERELKAALAPAPSPGRRIDWPRAIAPVVVTFDPTRVQLVAEDGAGGGYRTLSSGDTWAGEGMLMVHPLIDLRRDPPLDVGDLTGLPLDATVGIVLVPEWWRADDWGHLERWAPLSQATLFVRSDRALTGEELERLRLLEPRELRLQVAEPEAARQVLHATLPDTPVNGLTAAQSGHRPDPRPAIQREALKHPELTDPRRLADGRSSIIVIGPFDRGDGGQLRDLTERVRAIDSRARLVSDHVSATPWVSLSQTHDQPYVCVTDGVRLTFVRPMPAGVDLAAVFGEAGTAAAAQQPGDRGVPLFLPEGGAAEVEIPEAGTASLSAPGHGSFAVIPLRGVEEVPQGWKLGWHVAGSAVAQCTATLAARLDLLHWASPACGEHDRDRTVELLRQVPQIVLLGEGADRLSQAVLHVLGALAGGSTLVLSGVPAADVEAVRAALPQVVVNGWLHCADPADLQGSVTS